MLGLRRAQGAAVGRRPRQRARQAALVQRQGRDDRRLLRRHDGQHGRRPRSRGAYFGNSQNLTDEGFDTPLAFDFGFGRTPPTDPAAITAARDRLNPCDAAEHTARGYSETPDYDNFWLERDYRKDAEQVQVPALVVHGWQDYNVKQEEATEFYKALPGRGAAFKRLYMFQGAHASPRDAGFLTLLDAFFAKTLLGEDNGIEKGDPVLTQGRDATTSDKALRPEPSYPPPTTGLVDVPFQSAALGEGEKPAGERSYTDESTSTEEQAAREPDAQRQWLVYRSKPLLADTRLIDSPELDLTIRTSRDSGDLTPTLFDVPPAGTPVPITRGFLDVRYREGLAVAKPAPVNQPFRATVTFKPQDWTVRKGHRLMVILASSNTVWAIPSSPGLTVRVLEGRPSCACGGRRRRCRGQHPGWPARPHAGRRLPDAGRRHPGAGAGAGAGTGAGKPATPNTGKPAATPKLTVRLRALRRQGSRRVSRRRPSLLRATGEAPTGRYVLVRLQRGGRTVLTRKVKVVRGRYSITFRVRRGGTYTALATLPGRKVRTRVTRLR